MYGLLLNVGNFLFQQGNKLAQHILGVGVFPLSAWATPPRHHSQIAFALAADTWRLDVLANAFLLISVLHIIGEAAEYWPSVPLLRPVDHDRIRRASSEDRPQSFPIRVSRTSNHPGITFRDGCPLLIAGQLVPVPCIPECPGSAKVRRLSRISGNFSATFPFDRDSFLRRRR